MTEIVMAETAVAPTHLSHSQVSSFTRCGEAYRLQKIAGVRETPAYWSIGGSAFHTAVEHYESWRFQGETPSLEECVDVFTADLVKRYATESENWPDAADWRAGGRRSKQWPNKEDFDWWAVNGAQMVRDFYAWREAQPYEILELPDGSPAIETAFEIIFPANDYYHGVKVKGAIDAAIVYDTGVVGIRDYKSGSRAPESTSQLGLYRIALDDTVDVLASFGDYYLARKTATTDPDPLTQWTRDRLHAMYDGVIRGRNAGAFVASPGGICVTCGVQPFCRVKGDPEKSAKFAHVGISGLTIDPIL